MIDFNSLDFVLSVRVFMHVRSQTNSGTAAKRYKIDK